MNALLVDVYLDELLTDDAADRSADSAADGSADGATAARPDPRIDSDASATAPQANTATATAQPAIAATDIPAPLVNAQPATVKPSPIAPTTPDAPPLVSDAAMPARATASGALPATSRWLRVGVGTDHYALELLRVQEVVRVAPIIAMRGTHASVLGVMNLRGRIVPVLDLGRWLDGPAVSVQPDSRIVVVERDDELIGVLVTQVEDVTPLGREQVEPPLAGAAGVIVGIARAGRTPPVVLLDANALFG